jgi:hypothetical protein
MKAPFYLPITALTPDQRKRWAEEQLKRNQERAREAQRLQDQAMDAAAKKRDTKPLFYTDVQGDRPIIIYGGGKHFYNDLRDLAARAREEEWTARERLAAQRPNPWVTLHTALDQRRREAVGTKVFHIPSNPVSNKDR